MAKKPRIVKGFEVYEAPRAAIEDKGQWTKVSAGLPPIPVENEALAYNVYVHHREDAKLSFVHTLVFNGEGFGEESSDFDWNPYITHWIPLPEPPEDID